MQVVYRWQSCVYIINKTLFWFPWLVTRISKDLPPVSEIAQDVDVDSLESTFSTLGPKYMKKVQKGEASPGP